MDMGDCGVPKTIPLNVAFGEIKKKQRKTKIRKTNLKHETMKLLLVRGERTWCLYLVRK
jgi:hypothetical protein